MSRPQTLPRKKPFVAIRAGDGADPSVETIAGPFMVIHVHLSMRGATLAERFLSQPVDMSAECIV